MKLFFLICTTISLSSCFRNSKNIFFNEGSQNERVEDSLIQNEQHLIQNLLNDSIRIADSIAALPLPINYDTVLFASILRSPCHGKCPHYEIRLFQSGLVEYTGYDAVDKIGKYICRIDSNSILSISEMAEKCNFFNFKDFYPETGLPINDFPMCVCSIKNDKELKIVYNRNDAPLSLIKFQNFLDRIFEDRQWEAKR